MRAHAFAAAYVLVLASGSACDSAHIWASWGDGQGGDSSTLTSSAQATSSAAGEMATIEMSTSDASTTGASSSGTAAPAVCADLHLIVETTDMMNNLIDAHSRAWHQRHGILRFIDAPESSHVRIGLIHAPTPRPPIPCSMDDQCLSNSCFEGSGVCFMSSAETFCWLSSYVMPAIPFTRAPDVGPAVDFALLGATLYGTGQAPSPALVGALSYARSSATATGTSTAVVLFTSGLPGVCEYSDVSNLVQAAEEGFASVPSVRTYVMAIRPNEEHLYEWNRVAIAGGTKMAFVIDTAASIKTALDTIRKDVEKCP